MIPKHAALSAGLYEIYARDWLEVIPRKNFMFIKAEDYYSDRFSVINQTLKFLDIGNDTCTENFKILIHSIFIVITLKGHTRGHGLKHGIGCSVKLLY